VLVLGGSILGQGMETLLHYPQITLVETDVAFGPRTLMIADAHRIPLADESVDGVVVQAVLEHVMDPYQCVREIWRVLKPKGLVYAETPFMQQVHGWPYDFTRFTHLGHRRLFMQFEEMSSGVVNGPGVALAEAYQYFLMCFFKSSFLKKAAQIFARFTAFFLKYFDYFLIRRPGALAAASGYYFFGRKSWRTLSDRELLSFYNEDGEVGRK
jgi:SAM-dependent methyltransferase